MVGENDDTRSEPLDGTQGVEPDYRFTLANERTFLAWERTALGLLAAAVAVVQLVPELSIAGARHVLGAVLALLAILTAGMGILRWEQVARAIRPDIAVVHIVDRCHAADCRQHRHPGGRLVAQCGAGPNIAQVRERAGRLMASETYRAYFEGWPGPWRPCP